MIGVRIQLARRTRGAILVAGVLVAFVVGVVSVDSAYSSSPTPRMSAVRGRVVSGPLTGSVLHMVRIDAAGDTNETWTSTVDGLSKLVQKDAQGNITDVSTKELQPDGSCTVTDTDAVHGIQRSYTTRILPVADGRLDDGVWYGGERSLAGMRAEFEGYLRHAESNVVRTTLDGVPVRQFDAASSDGLWATIWLNDDGLPVQVKARTLATPNAFPLIEELPAASLSRAFLINTAAHPASTVSAFVQRVRP